MSNENENDQEGKEGPSTLKTREKSLEEQLEEKEKENADSPVKVVGEPLNPSENGHPIPAADVSADAEESVCTHVDSPRSSSTNVDIVDNQLGSVEPNWESVEAAAPLNLKDEATENKNMDLSDYQRDIVEPICESVEDAALLGIEDESTTDKTVDISHDFGDLVEPIRESVEGSVELVCETIENSVKHMQESVEATVSVNRKYEATAVENGGTTEPPLKEDGVDDSDLAQSHLAIRDLVEPICESVEGSVELICESVEGSVELICESVEATVSVDRTYEATAFENGVTPPLKEDDSNLAASHLQTGEAVDMAKVDNYMIRESKFADVEDNQPAVQEEDKFADVEDNQPAVQEEDASYMISYDDELEDNTVESMKLNAEQVDVPTAEKGNSSTKHLFLFNENDEGSVSGTEEEQSLFMKELENSFKERNMEFKPPKFYGEELNCLKLWRAVIGLGGYDRVTSNKLWRQVGESFRPPKTCTTVSWTFRGFYEKALLDFEREKALAGELSVQAPLSTESMGINNQVSGSARTPRDAATRARQSWHSQRLLSNDEVSDPIIKEKSAFSAQNRDKQLKNSGSFKRKKQPLEEDAETFIHPKVTKTQVDVAVVDIGLPADWVKINVQKTMDCFEVYALVPGLLREEVRVQSDPAGRLVISGDPEQPDNPWGVTPFKKVVTLPSRIDPHQTSAVVTLHGQLFVRVPFQLAEQ